MTTVAGTRDITVASILETALSTAPETPLERTVRTGRATGVRIDPVLAGALLGELLVPSPEVWVVSPWISDVPVLDNSRGDFDTVFGEPEARVHRLSDVLAELSGAGAAVTVVTRTTPSNTGFRTALDRRAAGQVRVVEDADVHEKTICGQSWLLTGSMNFTMRGMQINDEAMSYRLDATAAAQARVDYARRWGRR